MKRISAGALGAFLATASISGVACGAGGGPTPLDFVTASADLPPELTGAPEDAPRSAPGGELAGGEPDAPRPTTCPEGRWCSALYPPTWTPDAPADAEGRFLHDFSYAGYHNGEPPPATPPGATYDVVAGFGADPTGSADATAAIQRAIDAASAAGGGIVFFPEGTYRVGELLSVRTSGVVLRGTGKGSVLRFTKTSGMGYKAALTFTGVVTRDERRRLVSDAPIRANEVQVADATGLAPGDDVSVGWEISRGFIDEHQMAGTWKSFVGQYKPFFRRKVVAVDTSTSPHRVVLDVPLRYTAKTRDGASLQKESGYLREVGVEHLAVSSAVTWQAAWAEHQAYVLEMDGVADAWIDDVHSVPSPGATGMNAADERVYHLRSGGILVQNAKRVSVLRSSMENPQNRGSGGNGYLFEVSRTSEVLIADSEARNGRHNFIQNWDFGNSGTVFLRDVSIGSEMLSMIRGKLTPEEAFSEHHHSLAMATLVDDCRLEDGFKFENRGQYSDGAGHTGTGSVVWGSAGRGKIVSKQFGWGYVIGTHGLAVDTRIDDREGAGTAPEDFVEGAEKRDTLYPASLYEDQRALRLSKR